MSSPFENYLEEIAEEVSAPAHQEHIDWVISHVRDKLLDSSKDFKSFFWDIVRIGK